MNIQGNYGFGFYHTYRKSIICIFESTKEIHSPTSNESARAGKINIQIRRIPLEGYQLEKVNT